MAPSVVDMLNLPPNLPCRRCKTTPVSGLKCVLCGSVLHPSCVKFLKNVEMIVEGKFVRCCAEVTVDLDKTLDPTVVSVGEESNDSSLHMEINYLKQICHEKDKLNSEKDLVIATQAELIKSLKEQIIYMKTINLTCPPSGETMQTRQAPGSNLTKDSDTASQISAKELHLSINSQVIDRTVSLPSDKNSNSSTKSYLDAAKSTGPVLRQGVSSEADTINTKLTKKNPTTRTTQNSSSSENRAPKAKQLIGLAQNIALLSAPRLSFLHVYKLHPETTEHQLTEYLKAMFAEVECEKLNSKFPQYYASFKVSIQQDNLTRAMDPAIWPAGTHVNKFYHGKKLPAPMAKKGD